MYSTEQKILWLCIAILILSAISAKILYTQFGKESLLKAPTTYFVKKQNCYTRKPGFFSGKCRPNEKLCPESKLCTPKDCDCPVVCTSRIIDPRKMQMCDRFAEDGCADLKTCVPKGTAQSCCPKII